MLRLVTTYSGLTCRECGRVWEAPGIDDFGLYFAGGQWRCLGCGESQSLWAVLRAALRETNPMAPGAVALGMASAAYARLSLSAAPLTVDLADMGVPPEAKVLGVNFTPQDVGDRAHYFPSVTRQSYTSGALDHVFHMFGRRLGPDPDVADPTDVAVLCHWLHPNEDPELEPLASAMEAYAGGEYRQVIVPACVAVEDMLTTALLHHFEDFGRKGADEFVKSVSLAHKLRYLLPSLMKSYGAPELPLEVRKELMTLRTVRNDVAHRHREVAREEAADMLLGALFGVRYLRLYGMKKAIDADS